MLKHYLGITDYIVICFSLLISAGIGIAVKYYGSQKTAKDYLLAGGKMAKLPVILSIAATVTSPITVIGAPSEVYRYGLKYIITFLVMPFGMFLASLLFIPVYYQCGVSTVNEFLEMRFGKIIKWILSTFFLLQMMLFMSVALYGAVLALSAVTDLSFGTSIVSLGAICTLYCFLGGLKAVLWTDVFQIILMLICILSFFITGIQDAGGVSNIYEKAKAGHRLDDIFNPRLDFMERFNFWSCIIRGITVGCTLFGTNQLDVQRILSLSNVDRAKSTLRMSAFPTFFLYALCQVFGVVLYGIYHDCDPILDKEHSGLTKHDQMVPAFIVKRFSNIPGMTGLCIAGIFCASLSTISSALNCASTVTVVDFIKPLLKSKQITEEKIVWLAKIASLIYGGICIGLSFCFLGVKSIKRLALVVVYAADGPILALFLVAVLSRKASDKCVSFAFLFGVILISWISYGSLFSNYSQPLLPMSVSGCSSFENTSISVNASLITPSSITPSFTKDSSRENIFILYRISHVWYSGIGFVLTSVCIFVTVLLTGWRKNVIPADSKCLSPILWNRTKQQTKYELSELEARNVEN
ncbi:putative sodium-dependent multivitamin transporter [Parasteatoda tepidariorum]|uniref:putative sodium-dependent multivitamin transporter n=1 Tax=Parasteatoda tepidariorum TaxID=114398 RepID=UPI00077FBE13|nr:putative sodium-dependent multivitamin transporter [Parasteatoda tepidariorum]